MGIFTDLLPVIGAGVGTAFGSPQLGYAAGSGLQGAIRGGGGSSQQGGSKSSNTYVPTGLGAADQTFQQLLAQLTSGGAGAASAITPEIANAFRSMLGIDTGGSTGAGAAAGQQYGNVAGQAQGAGNYQMGLGRGVGDAGQQFWQTSLDPQNAMRDRMQQQVTDASRAGTSARGIGMSGEASGIENQAVGDFLRNWNFDQLQRQATGLQGYGNAANQSGRTQAGGLGMGMLGGEAAMQAGQVPFGANMQAGSLPFQAAGMYSTAQGGANQGLGGILGQIIPYLNQGLGATNQSFGQGQVGMNNTFTGLSQLGSAMGGKGGSTGGGFGGWEHGGYGGTGDWLSNLFQGGGGSSPTGSWDMGGGNWMPENSFGGG